MSFIGSAVNSALTPAGTHQRQSEVNQQSGYSGSVYNNLWPGLQGYLGAQQQFQTSQLPNLEKGVENAYYNTTQGGRNAEVQNYGQQAQAGAREQGAQAYSQAAGNQSLAKGASLAAMNTANQGTNQYAAGVNSPQGQAQAWSQYAGLLGQTNPNYGNLGSFNSAIYGQPQVPVSQGIGGALGALLPTVLAGATGGSSLGVGSLLGLLGGSGGGANLGAAVSNGSLNIDNNGFYY